MNPAMSILRPMLASLAFAALAPISISAQQTDTELLKAILCELRELRAAVRQGQVSTPLLEANMREREQTLARLTQLEEQMRTLDGAMEANMGIQSHLNESLRTLPRVAGGSGPDEEAARQQKRSLEIELAEISRTLREQQSRQSLLSADISRTRARLDELKDEFDQIQRQMRSLAAASSTICETAAQD